MISDRKLMKISDYLGKINELIADMQKNGFYEAADLLGEVKEVLYREMNKELGFPSTPNSSSKFDAYLVAHLYNMGLISKEEARQLLGLDKAQDLL
ncbi:hypothetical protein [Archaeoglobus profundus]|uniref:Uncharacterized protein n=1 Tax=Archaeoglobus profundus (strain DSM 5631 / JCM 9629 / NBRC 100127 / Av18) TaxID=572546 RepID=D2REM6_ARCPA|nr:hypothetical protein [Archaeoglobus profundus]ADB58570.1 hypothetical protein Arcpr_1524 [Archaeoglobus profundus DSM 5631]